MVEVLPRRTVHSVVDLRTDPELEEVPRQTVLVVVLSTGLAWASVE